jgi:peptidoglycan/xylan/chitin deacetylase (PgdA/CDA1 family)
MILYTDNFQRGSIVLRIWKLVFVALLSCFLLAGCGDSSTQKSEGTTVAAAPQKQVEMAVPKKGIPVLMYHMIGDVKDNDAVLLESHLREQMQFLKDNDFHPISLDQLYDYMVHNKPVPVRPVVLTFDDGYPDTYSVVMPIMKEYGFKCTVFIPAYDADNAVRLNWKQIKEMKESGIDIASHGYHHNRLNEMNGNTLAEEIKKSQEELKQQLGITNEFFCYPYGGDNPAAEAALKKAGIKLAFTMNGGWAKYGDNPYAVKRIWIGNAVDIANFKQRVTTEQYAQR